MTDGCVTKDMVELSLYREWVELVTELDGSENSHNALGLTVQTTLTWKTDIKQL